MSNYNIETISNIKNNIDIIISIIENKEFNNKFDSFIFGYIIGNLLNFFK